MELSTSTALNSSTERTTATTETYSWAYKKEPRRALKKRRRNFRKSDALRYMGILLKLLGHAKKKERSSVSEWYGNRNSKKQVKLAGSVFWLLSFHIHPSAAATARSNLQRQTQRRRLSFNCNAIITPRHTANLECYYSFLVSLSLSGSVGVLLLAASVHCCLAMMMMRMKKERKGRDRHLIRNTLPCQTIIRQQSPTRLAESSSPVKTTRRIYSVIQRWIRIRFLNLLSST